MTGGRRERREKERETADACDDGQPVSRPGCIFGLT
jgi:hypothetical protein